MIRGLHHVAFRCRDSEATRSFYEDLLGLEFAHAISVDTTKTGRSARLLHSFYRMADGSFVAFFEAPDEPFDFAIRRDIDLHLALEVDVDAQERISAVARARGIDVRGPSDHEFIKSIYLRDPDGYVVELTTRTPAHDAILAEGALAARGHLAKWQAAKAAGDEHRDDIGKS